MTGQQPNPLELVVTVNEMDDDERLSTYLAERARYTPGGWVFTDPELGPTLPRRALETTA